MEPYNLVILFIERLKHRNVYACPKIQFQMGGLSKSHLASLAALGLAGMGPTTNGAINPTGMLNGQKEFQ